MPSSFSEALATARIEADIARYRRRGPKCKPKKRQPPAGPTIAEAHTKIVVVGVARAEIARHGRTVSSLNREATALAETLVGEDDRPWATDEPTPDLSVLWDSSVPSNGRLEGARYEAWLTRYPEIAPRRRSLKYAHPLTIERGLDERAA